MRLPGRLARFNRHVTNPIQRLWAGKIPLFGIVEHAGRKSGKAYRTPVNVFAAPGGFALFLTYGPDRDWVRNVVAAGGAKLEHRGRTCDVTDPRVIPAAEAASFLGKGPATLLKRLNLEYVMRLTAS